MICPAIQIGTQWVMVDKTRVPVLNEFCAWESGFKGVGWQIGMRADSDPDENYKHCLPILAAFPKLEGVPLIPEWAFKKRSPIDLAMVQYPVDDPKRDLAIVACMRVGFVEGFEAAGGYTREDIKQFPEWLYDGGWEFNGISRCWSHVNGSNKTTNALVDIYISSLQNLNSPSAFDCEENPDGSPKIENDTIVLKNLIR